MGLVPSTSIVQCPNVIAGYTPAVNSYGNGLGENFNLTVQDVIVNQIVLHTGGAGDQFTLPDAVDLYAELLLVQPDAFAGGRLPRTNFTVSDEVGADPGMNLEGGAGTTAIYSVYVNVAPPGAGGAVQSRTWILWFYDPVNHLITVY